MADFQTTLTPEEAAKKIVSDLCADLSAERQEQLREAIELAMSDWGDLVGGVVAEDYGHAV